MAFMCVSVYNLESYEYINVIALILEACKL